MKFHEIKMSNHFKYRGELYRKVIDSDNPKFIHYNAIRLLTGKHSFFSLLTNVSPYSFPHQVSIETVLPKEFKEQIVQIIKENLLIVKELKRLKSERDDLLDRLSRSTVGQELLTKLNIKKD